MDREQRKQFLLKLISTHGAEAVQAELELSDRSMRNYQSDNGKPNDRMVPAWKLYRAEKRLGCQK